MAGSTKISIKIGTHQNPVVICKSNQNPLTNFVPLQMEVKKGAILNQKKKKKNWEKKKMEK